MAKVDLRKTVYNKTQFDKVVGGRDFKTFTTFVAGQDVFTVEDFFREYETLFLTIPINGNTNSHEFIVRKSGELVGFQRSTEDIQPLLDEITSLREQLLDARQEIVDLQVGDVNEDSLKDQFQDILQALSEPIELPDIILPDINIDINNEEEEKDDPDRLLPKPKDDVILVSIDADKTVNRGSVNVLENDADAFGNPVVFEGIKDAPKYGKVEVLDVDEGIVQYIPNLRAPSGNKADQFTYTISDKEGRTEVGTVFINITNNALLVTEPGADTITVDIIVNDPSNPNNSYIVEGGIKNLLDNDEGLDLAFDGIISNPKYGSVTVLDDQQGIVEYVPRIGIGSDKIELGAYFTEGANVEPVTEDEFYYQVKNLNTAARTATTKVTVRFFIPDAETPLGVDPKDEANGNANSNPREDEDNNNDNTSSENGSTGSNDREPNIAF